MFCLECDGLARDQVDGWAGDWLPSFFGLYLALFTHSRFCSYALRSKLCLQVI